MSNFPTSLATSLNITYPCSLTTFSSLSTRWRQKTKLRHEEHTAQ